MSWKIQLRTAPKYNMKHYTESTWKTIATAKFVLAHTSNPGQQSTPTEVQLEPMQVRTWHKVGYVYII